MRRRRPVRSSTDATPDSAAEVATSSRESGRAAGEDPTAVRDGRVPTWEEVARDHGKFLYTVCYRLCGDPDTAQDLVQEVLLRVRAGLNNYEPRGLHAWLSKIATNIFLDEMRRRKRRVEDPMPDDAERRIPGSAGADQALDEAKLPEHVQAALRRLPEDYRAAVVLCDVVGMSYEEIAAVLGVPLGTVRSRIHRGRALLRSALR